MLQTTRLAVNERGLAVADMTECKEDEKSKCTDEDGKPGCYQGSSCKNSYWTEAGGKCCKNRQVFCPRCNKFSGSMNKAQVSRTYSFENNTKSVTTKALLSPIGKNEIMYGFKRIVCGDGDGDGDATCEVTLRIHQMLSCVENASLARCSRVSSAFNVQLSIFRPRKRRHALIQTLKEPKMMGIGAATAHC